MRKWKARLAAVALGLSAALVQITPATAAPTPKAPAAGPAQECSEDLKQQAAVLAAAGKSGTATCTRKKAKRIDLDTGTATGDMSINADICGGSTVRTRVGTCLVEDGVVVIFQVPSGAIIGNIGYTTSSLTTVHHNSLEWSQSFHYQANYVSGPSIPAVTGTQIYGEPQCISNCTPTGASQFVGGSALPGRAHSATNYYSTPLAGHIWYAQAGFKFWFHNPAWVTQNTNTLTTTAGQHRCDDALPGYPKGCVYHSIRPVLDIPTARYPKYAEHIRVALLLGLPSVLTRTQNQSIRDRNRDIACPGGYNNPNPGYLSCDEYPFASTYNGAASHTYGRTIFIFNKTTGYIFDCQVSWLNVRAGNDSGGYSVCLIPLSENVSGGSDLGIFYYESRVLDGDQFQVRVV